MTISLDALGHAIEEAESTKRGQLPKEPCSMYMRGRCTFGSDCRNDHNVPREGCMKNWYGNCPNKAEDCSYGHAKTDLCPFLVRDGACTRKGCSLVHVDPRVAFKAKAAKAKPKGIDLAAVFEKAALVPAAIPKVEVGLVIKTEKFQEAPAAATHVPVKVESSAQKAKLPIQLLLDVFNGGLRGDALLEKVKTVAGGVHVGGFFQQILLNQNADSLSLNWCSDAQFGTLLKHWAEISSNQLAFLNEVLKFCSTEDFPSMQVKGVDRSYLELVFLMLWKSAIVQEKSFLDWADGQDDSDDDSKGKQKALIQLNDFIMQLRENEIQEDEEEGEELDDEDVKTAEMELPALRPLMNEKDITKAAKKERRAAKLAERGSMFARIIAS
jgi:hypothetical protein